MAVIIHTNKRKEVVAGIKSLVREGYIRTWLIDDDEDLTINNEKWICKAWFEIIPNQEDNNVIGFGIIKSKKYKMTKELYAVYHGRLATTLLAYFDDMIQKLEITSNYNPLYDRIQD